MDNATASSLVADSKAPTVVTSNGSISDAEKASLAQSARDTDAVSVAGEPSRQAEAQEDEKANPLALHPTATSKAGDAVQQVVTREDGSAYPTGLKFGLIMLALCLSVFLVALGKHLAAALLWSSSIGAGSG